ncbi:MAG: hypothetical protein ACO394_14130 [Blastocatellia bacterium]
MEDNYNQPVDQVPARVRSVARDAHTHADVILWLPLDGETPVLSPDDFNE